MRCAPQQVDHISRTLVEMNLPHEKFARIGRSHEVDIRCLTSSHIQINRANLLQAKMCCNSHSCLLHMLAFQADSWVGCEHLLAMATVVAAKTQQTNFTKASRSHSWSTIPKILSSWACPFGGDWGLPDNILLLLLTPKHLTASGKPLGRSASKCDEIWFSRGDAEGCWRHFIHFDYFQ